MEQEGKIWDNKVGVVVYASELERQSKAEIKKYFGNMTMLIV